MAMEPIWENDFHTLSYGFRPKRIVHHTDRTVKLQRKKHWRKPSGMSVN